MTNPWGFAFDYWGQSFSTDGAGWQGPHYCFPGVAYGMAVNVKETLGGLIMTGRPKNTAAEFVSGSHAPDHWQGSLLANDFRANRTVRYEIEEEGLNEEFEMEQVLRPKLFEDFEGQDKIVNNLKCNYDKNYLRQSY